MGKNFNCPYGYVGARLRNSRATGPWLTQTQWPRHILLYIRRSSDFRKSNLAHYRRTVPVRWALLRAPGWGWPSRRVTCLIYLAARHKLRASVAIGAGVVAGASAARAGPLEFNLIHRTNARRSRDRPPRKIRRIRPSRARTPGSFLTRGLTLDFPNAFSPVESLVPSIRLSNSRRDLLILWARSSTVRNRVGARPPLNSVFSSEQRLAARTKRASHTYGLRTAFVTTFVI
ncbi:hypothetical protein EVAR_4777_1 [Eumeta japonica]|uniref:Uncharacterized protein n=1 Tax=Eumeta variegata TaxID=151549 RepID=A0A4C1SZL1_EUMVA|nr:hypothetical protein EVAR_4777_1 [Eumeta japonica]